MGDPSIEIVRVVGQHAEQSGVFIGEILYVALLAQVAQSLGLVLLRTNACWKFKSVTKDAHRCNYNGHPPTQEQQSVYLSPRHVKHSLQQVQSFLMVISHLHDWVSMHLLTTGAHRASLHDSACCRLKMHASSRAETSNSLSSTSILKQ